jgi:hypothetical protein
MYKMAALTLDEALSQNRDLSSQEKLGFKRGWNAACGSQAIAPFASDNKQSTPVCPGIEKCENFGACGDCLRHPALHDKWLAKPTMVCQGMSNNGRG